MPRKMRHAALCSALSVKANESGIVLIDELKLTEPKTRQMAKALDILVGTNSVLILIPEKSAEYESVIRSTRNIEDAKILVAGYLNIRDLLTFDKLVLPLASLERIEKVLG
jgi:large subunit ribosomal protein L4